MIDILIDLWPIVSGLAILAASVGALFFRVTANEARLAGKQPVERRTYLEVPTPEDGPVLQKIYDWLKVNEPLFDGAVDV